MKKSQSPVLLLFTLVLANCAVGDVEPLVTRILPDVDPDKPLRLKSIKHERASDKSLWFEYFTYDDQGQLIRQELDNDNDGVIDQRFSFTYQARGMVDKALYEVLSGLGPDLDASYFYDANGLLASIDYDRDKDGNRDDYAEYTHDANSQLERMDVKNLAGETQYYFLYYYDAHDMVKEIYSSSTNQTRTNKNFYDTNGFLTRREVDKDGDGNLDQTGIYIYENGPCIYPEAKSLRRNYCYNQ